MLGFGLSIGETTEGSRHGGEFALVATGFEHVEHEALFIGPAHAGRPVTPWIDT
jgi:hypothetical protein